MQCIVYCPAWSTHDFPGLSSSFKTFLTTPTVKIYFTS